MRVLMSTVALYTLAAGAVHAAEVKTTPATPGPVPLTDAQMDRVTAGAGKGNTSMQILGVRPSSDGRHGGVTPYASKGGASLQM